MMLASILFSLEVNRVLSFSLVEILLINRGLYVDDKSWLLKIVSQEVKNQIHCIFYLFFPKPNTQLDTNIAITLTQGKNDGKYTPVIDV